MASRSLAPCAGCARHVRTADLRCPFCDAPAPRGARAPVRLARSRLTRAAVFAGAALLAPACGGDRQSEETVMQPYGAPPPEPEIEGDGDGDGDDGDDRTEETIAQPYGAPPDPDPVGDGERDDDPRLEVEPIAPPYGAPPSGPISV